MAELDLSTVRLVHEKRQEEMVECFYRNSINKERTEVKGKKYVGKGIDLKPVIASALGIAAVILTTKVGYAIEEVSEYNDQLEARMEQELTEKQIAAYDKDHTNPISNFFESYEEIKESKQELNPEDYNFLGKNITDTEMQYVSFDEDSLINLTGFSQDAIEDAVSDKIGEYKRRG